MTDPITPPILPGFKKAFEGDGFKSDARIFLLVGDSAFNSIVSELEVASGIVGQSRFRQAILNAGITDETQIQLLLRIIPIFVGWGKGIAQGKTESLLATMRVALSPEFEDAQLATLAVRFGKLLEGDFIGLVLAGKAEGVARAIGRGLRSVQLITDVRPVFDAERERVVAVVPMTTLKLTTESNEEGVPISTCEVQLSESELMDFSKRIAEAQQKLAIMKKLLSEKNIDIAESTMVMVDGEAV